MPKGTALQVALDNEVRVKRVGQPLQGRLVEPVFAFDREVLPVGSQVVGRISAIEGPSGGKRFLAALDVDFSPTRTIHVEFDEIILPDGKRLPLKAVVTPGSGRPIQLITTADKSPDQKKTSSEAGSGRMKQALEEAKRKWQSATKQVKEPGKMRRLGRYAVAQLPVHPQYIPAGTVYFAELQEPLDFGNQPLPPALPVASGTALPPCTLLAHAQLETPLDSATTPPDTPVEAVLTRPLTAGGQLIFPQGSRLKGSVVQVQPARRFGRSGTLRIIFDEIVPPEGMQQKVNASLEGVQADKDQNVKLDLEGRTRPAAPKKRYLSSGVAVALAVASYQDSDVAEGGSSRGTASQGGAGGAVAFKLVGIVAGAFSRSRSLALGMGVFGAGKSVYSNFLSRGRDVVFPKGTAMEIGFWLKENCADDAATTE
ncbi:MAG: hypothetical protein ACRD35_07765 [Candidatus Acidiferrales bacterium]